MAPDDPTNPTDPAAPAPGGEPQPLRPTIKTLEPQAIHLETLGHEGELPLKVTGENFVSQSVVRLDGRDLPTALASDQQSLTTHLSPAILPKSGVHQITVFTPGGGESAAKPLFANPRSRWGTLEKLLVLGAGVFAGLWVFWIFRVLAGAEVCDAEDAKLIGCSVGEKIPPESWQLSWLAGVVILAIFTFGVGRALTGTWKSLLIDERNKQSLSQLQLVVWTGLVLAGIATAAAWNVRHEVDEPLAISIPFELWILLGISGTVLVGSSLIKEQKKGGVTSDEAKKALAEMGQTDQGALSANVSPLQARWTDMFKFEGAEHPNKLDVGKVQMFFFTVILVLAYAGAFAAKAFDTKTGVFQFPALDASMITLLGISSVTYLAFKAGNSAGGGSG